MIKNLLIILLFISITNCKLNKVEKNHGVSLLEEKFKTLQVNISNKNDIIEMLGSPSITDSFDDNTYIYIERKTSSSQLRKLGKRQLIKNNILLLELNNKGMLVKKTLLDKENMKKLKFSEDITGDEFGADSAVYNFIKALRNKINDPLGQKK